MEGRLNGTQIPKFGIYGRYAQFSFSSNFDLYEASIVFFLHSISFLKTSLAYVFQSDLTYMYLVLMVFMIKGAKTERDQHLK